MSRRPAKAQTADGPMVFPALEMQFPPEQRITEDPYAKPMLSPVVKLMVSAMRWRRVRRLGKNFLDKALPGLWGGMVARKRYADGAVADALATGIRQFVILGAGFDTRSFRLIAPAGAEAYEVDMPDNIARKERLLRRMFSKTPEHVNLVAADFESAGLAESLVSNGFQPDKPTMYIMEAVTQYLTEEAMSELLRYLKKAPVASRFIFTYIDQAFLDGDDLGDWEMAYRKYVEKGLWTYGIHYCEVGDLLSKYGWTEREQMGDDEYQARYFAPAGRDLRAMRFERFVMAEKTA